MVCVQKLFQRCKHQLVCFTFDALEFIILRLSLGNSNTAAEVLDQKHYNLGRLVEHGQLAGDFQILSVRPGNQKTFAEFLDSFGDFVERLRQGLYVLPLQGAKKGFEKVLPELGYDPFLLSTRLSNWAQSGFYSRVLQQLR